MTRLSSAVGLGRCESRRNDSVPLAVDMQSLSANPTLNVKYTERVSECVRYVHGFYARVEQYSVNSSCT